LPECFFAGEYRENYKPLPYAAKRFPLIPAGFSDVRGFSWYRNTLHPQSRLRGPPPPYFFALPLT
jgi:hypothetical protein